MSEAISSFETYSLVQLKQQQQQKLHAEHDKLKSFLTKENQFRISIISSLLSSAIYDSPKYVFGTKKMGLQ